MRKTLIILIVTAAGTGLFAQSASTGYKTVNFWPDLIMFAYNENEYFESAPHKVTPSGVPSYIWQLDGQKISTKGLGLALTADKDGSDEFIITTNEDTCGYGVPPRLNEFISVKMNGSRKAVIQTGMLYTVQGTLHVKEVVEDGRVVELYSMNADSVK